MRQASVRQWLVRQWWLLVLIIAVPPASWLLLRAVHQDARPQADQRQRVDQTNGVASSDLNTLLRENPRPWILAQSLPLSGPSANLGQRFSMGMDVFLQDLNRRGGVAGRPVKIWRLDDQYEPEQTAANTRLFVKHPEVLALFGYVGTPTTKASLPIAAPARLTLIAPLTGASSLRQPGQSQIAHLRASYADEAGLIIQHLLNDGYVRIAIAYQNDAYGDDVSLSLRKALAASGRKPIASVPLPRNSLATDAAARQLAAAQPDALVVVSTSRTMASLVRQMKDLGSSPQVMTVSFTDAVALFDVLPRHQTFGIGVTHVVPFPWDQRSPLVADYQQAIRGSDPKAGFDFVSFEGYLAARWLGQSLQAIQPIITRERLSKQILSSAGSKPGMGLDVGLVFLGTDPWKP